MYNQAESQLGLNFLKTLPAHNESVVFSPISIALVLSLVHTGARGNSKKQIENTLLNCDNGCQYVNYFSGVAKNLKQGINGIEVYMPNRLYLKNRSAVQQNFLTAITQNYGADYDALDFKQSGVSQKISGYVKKATNGVIDNMVTRKDSIENANSLLINAMYFKGDWEDQFPNAPVSQWFHRNEKNSYLMNFMADVSVREYTSDDFFQVVTLKYADPRYQFAIFLPTKRNSLNEALKKLDNKRFNSLLNHKKSTFISIEIPKFTVQYRISLKNSLKAIGITEIFSDFADLSGIGNGVKLSEGIHKSFIKINEDGTTAAPTKPRKVLSVTRTGNPIQFKADHPFLFAVTYMNHSIYMGVYRGESCENKKQ